MNLQLARSVLEDGLLLSVFLFLVVLVLSIGYDIRRAIWHKYTVHRHARRTHITVIIDGRVADEVHVHRTLEAVRKSTYTKYDVVTIVKPGTGKLFKDETVCYTPREYRRTVVHEAFKRSQKGDIVVVIKAGETVSSRALQTINREFFFTPSLEVLAISSGCNIASSYDTFFFTVTSALVQMTRRAMDVSGVYFSNTTTNKAFRAEHIKALGVRPVHVSPPLFQHQPSSPTKLVLTAMGVYALVASFVIIDYLYSAMAMQLVTFIFCATLACVVLALSASWHSLREKQFLVFIAPASFFVLFINALTAWFKVLVFALPKRIMKA